MRAIRVETALGSWMENRNGMLDIRAITATQYSNDFIYIEGISRSQNSLLRGGFYIDKEAFLEFCRRGLEIFQGEEEPQDIDLTVQEVDKKV